MADEKDKKTKTEEVKQVTPLQAKLNLQKRVEVKCSDKAPYHKEGEITKVSEHVAKKMEKNGWGTIVSILLLVFFAFGAKAQTSSFQKMVNGALDSAVVTNTGTGYVTSPAMKNLAFSTVINARVWKTNGTIAGTITLQGSLDGVNFSTVKSSAYSMTATATPTDVAGAQSFSFTLLNNPYIYYRLSYTGAGTMAGSIKGTVWSH